MFEVLCSTPRVFSITSAFSLVFLLNNLKAPDRGIYAAAAADCGIYTATATAAADRGLYAAAALILTE
jgi:hypothetical protein